MIKMLKCLLNHFSTQKPRLFVLAGQGTQQRGMLSKLLDIAQAKNQIICQSETLGIDFIEISTTDKSNLINLTKYTQPLLVLSQVLAYKYLYQPKGIKVRENDFMIGHSIGEYSALCIAQSSSFSQTM